MTVTVDAAGRYHASFVVDAPDAPAPAAGREVGIDLGLTHFAVLSDGRKVDKPRIARKAAAKLRRAQQELARRQKGSARRKVGPQGRTLPRPGHRHPPGLAAQAVDHIVQENQPISVEDLAVSGLARTRLARSVNDAGWSTFVAMLAYKARRHGRTFVKVDRWLPSTRACSACGAIGEAKPLHVRELDLPLRRRAHDRDVNAARNILAAGRAESSETLVELVSAGTPVPQPAVKREPAGSTA